MGKFVAGVALGVVGTLVWAVLSMETQPEKWQEMLDQTVANKS